MTKKIFINFSKTKKSKEIKFRKNVKKFYQFLREKNQKITK